LYLFDNEIEVLKENIFESLTNLQELNLSHNKITEIKEDSFKSLTNLQKLDISRNKITKIENDAFKSLTNLQELNLSKNQIEVLKENIFESLTNLEMLALFYNKIKAIEKNIFKSLTNLRGLYLDNNKITILEENVFESLTSLKNLDISDIKIKALPLSILNCTRLRELHIYGNEITLDIRIKRFIDRMRNYNNHDIFRDSQNLHSSSIQKSTQESINNLMKDEFDLPKDKIVEQLIGLEPKCLTSLLCYLDDKEIHSILLLTFYEVFVKVFGRIVNSEHESELVKRLDEEMQESECKCFTGRMTRFMTSVHLWMEWARRFAICRKQGMAR
jgi:hypothetical protein